MIFLTASNSGLTAGAIFGAVLLILSTLGFIKAIIDLIRDKNKDNLMRNVQYVIAGLFMMGIGGYITLLESNLLRNYRYVEGITIGYCITGKPRMKAIEFEYYIDGKRYTNCNSYKHLNTIKVPDGRFNVRVSDFEPSSGRIDFKKPLTLDSKSD